MGAAMECIAYKAGYKYQLKENYVAEIPIKPEVSIDTEYLTLTLDGILTVKKVCAWYGPSGPTVEGLFVISF